MKEDEMKIIKVLVDEMPSGCKRCDFCVAKMYCLLLEDRKTTVPDEPYKRRTDCPLVYDFGDRETNALNKRIAELSQAVGLITTLKPTMVMDVDHPLDMAKEVAEYVTARIADLEEDKHSLRDSNLWLKQNYEDLERDYGVMYDKLCARIDSLTAENKVLEDACEILRKENRRLFSQVFSNGKPEPKVCEACGGDGTVLLRDGYEGQVIATAKCIYCNGTGRVNKESEE